MLASDCGFCCNKTYQFASVSAFYKEKNADKKQLPRLFCPSPGLHVENLWRLLHSRPTTWWQMAQTSCRPKSVQRQHQCLGHSGEHGRMPFIRYSRWIFRHMLLKSWQVLAVLVIEPLHLEVQVHIICTFTQTVLLMLWIVKRKKTLGKTHFSTFSLHRH